MTVGELMEYTDNPSLQKYRDREVVKSMTVAELEELLGVEEKTVSEEIINEPITVGEIMDFIRTNEALQEKKDQTITVNLTVG